MVICYFGAYDRLYARNSLQIRDIAKGFTLEVPTVPMTCGTCLTLLQPQNCCSGSVYEFAAKEGVRREVASI
jgi:hypothetical protein